MGIENEFLCPVRILLQRKGHSLMYDVVRLTVCMCVCVCEREREKEGGGERRKRVICYLSSHIHTLAQKLSPSASLPLSLSLSHTHTKANLVEVTTNTTFVAGTYSITYTPAHLSVNRTHKHGKNAPYKCKRSLLRLTHPCEPKVSTCNRGSCLYMDMKPWVSVWAVSVCICERVCM